MIKALVLVLAMYAGSFGPALTLAGHYPDEEVTPPHDEQAAFDFACKVMQYDCAGIPLPEVVWSNLFMTEGLFGGYQGGNVILLDNSVLRWADDVFLQSILAHETVHYLDVQLGLLSEPYDKAATCDSEFRAWRVGNAYVIANGRPDFADFTWHVRYGCYQ